MRLEQALLGLHQRRRSSIRVIWTYGYGCVIFLRERWYHRSVSSTQGTNKYHPFKCPFSQRKERNHSPALHEILPDVISQSICRGQLLYEMLNRVLTQPEEVRARDGVRVLPVTDRVGLFHDARPGARCCARDDGCIWCVGRDDLEFRAISTVENCAVIDNFGVRIDCGVISPAGSRSVRLTEISLN
jgi:hypothetical protein